MNEALKRMLFSSRYPASRFSISRVASETSVTTSNIVRAPKRLVAASPSAQRCVNTLMTAWVPARFPELSKTTTRLPRRSNTVILQNLAKLSTPAFVRESEAKIMPSSSITPMQYVMRCAWCATNSPSVMPRASGCVADVQVSDAQFGFHPPRCPEDYVSYGLGGAAAGYLRGERCRGVELIARWQSAGVTEFEGLGAFLGGAVITSGCFSGGG